MWLQRKRTDPDSATIVFQCIWCSFAALCFVQQSCQSIVRLAATVSLFGLSPHHLQCLIHPSVPRTFLAQIVNPEGPNDGWKAAKASTTLAHRAVPRREQRAFPHFCRMLSCRVDPLKADDACCWHATQATSTDHFLLAPPHPKLTPPPAGSFPHARLTTFAELSAAPLDCGSPSADVSCTISPVQANFTARSKCKNGRLIVAPKHHSVVSQKCPNF